MSAVTLTVFASVCITFCTSFPGNDTGIISTYAKVAHWGPVIVSKTPETEARSHRGQTLWTHRADANVVSGQNLKKKPAVVYQYPVQKIGSSKSEPYPGVGEVQERFNPRPYFDYVQAPPKGQKSDHKASPSSSSSSSVPAPPVVAAPAPSPTFDSFPVFNQPLDSPPSNLYDSGYNSYLPPNSGPVGPPNDKPDVLYPPNASPPSENSSPSKGYSYNPPKTDTSDTKPPAAYPSLGPPLAPSDDDDNHHNFYNHDHKHELYYPPSDDHETILDHPPPGWEEPKEPIPSPMSSMSGTDVMTPMKDDMKGMNDGKSNMGNNMAEDDLSPPPASAPHSFGQFPNYLYNGAHGHDHDFGVYDFDHHHVYKEVTTTTTTEAPEDERVNKGHYSYYYLGRKLWYIPLYFSVYFIIYVTVLILKSIARHKIQLKHEFTSRAKGRSLDIDDIHRNVTDGIQHARRKFAYVAM